MIDEHDHQYRVGLGTDIHKLVADRRLMLAGLHVPFSAGLAGHSDGDVALHAVIDGLLGASGLADIGTMFPDTDPKLKDADSKGLLLDVKQKLAEKRWTIVNIDLTIQAEQPGLAPFKAQMKRCIASLLGIDFNAVNVKAKTGEGLGPVGAGQAIAAKAVVLLRKRIKRSL